jgi:hypothetical protein
MGPNWMTFWNGLFRLPGAQAGWAIFPGFQHANHLLVIELSGFGDEQLQKLRRWPMGRHCNGVSLAETESSTKQRPAGNHARDIGQV